MNYIKIGFSFIITSIIYFLGGWDIALQSLIIAIILDYLTGIGKAYISKELNSYKGLKGIVKKVGLLCLVALSVLLDNILGKTGAIRTLIIYYIVANEGLSIIENLGKMDIIVPKFIIDKLEQLKESTESGVSDESN